jgi:hypothetical protein
MKVSESEVAQNCTDGSAQAVPDFFHLKNNGLLF